MKVFVKLIACMIGSLILAGILFVAYLTITEYNPKSIESPTVRNAKDAKKIIRTGETLKFLSWNIGYSGLGDTEDFFLDGGTKSRPDSFDFVRKNIHGISKFISENEADFIFLQEVDLNSKRSYYLNQYDFLIDNLSLLQYSGAFALNYLVNYVPLPLTHPMGYVEGGILIFAKTAPEKAERLALPSPFSWPVRVANLKRCMLVEYIPIANSSKYLVLCNFHLEAYSSDEGRQAQADIVFAFLKNEYTAGNYCIAGGDFNQSFPGVNAELVGVKSPTNWMPGQLLNESLPGPNWQYAADLETASARSLDRAYIKGDPAMQFYVIDGFILSPNIEKISVETTNMDFKYSDHHPVSLYVKLK